MSNATVYPHMVANRLAQPSLREQSKGFSPRMLGWAEVLRAILAIARLQCNFMGSARIALPTRQQR